MEDFFSFLYHRIIHYNFSLLKAFRIVEPFTKFTYLTATYTKLLSNRLCPKYLQERILKQKSSNHVRNLSKIQNKKLTDFIINILYIKKEKCQCKGILHYFKQQSEILTLIDHQAEILEQIL